MASTSVIGEVVHYAGLAYGLYQAPVEEVSLTQFARGRGVWARWRRPPAFDHPEIVRRARSRVGEARYGLLNNNCEHFCEWCVHGEARSYQVEHLLSLRRLTAIIMAWIMRGSATPAASEREKWRSDDPEASWECEAANAASAAAMDRCVSRSDKKSILPPL